MNKGLFLFVFFLFLVACVPAQEAQPQAPIKIGVAVPLTGAWAPGGEAAHRGMRIAFDEINAAGGIDGRPLELVVEDTRSEVVQAVTAMHKLIDVDRVPLILAGILSAEAVAVAPIAQEAKVVILSPLALTTPLETAGEWVFKLRESTGVHAKTTLGEIAKRGHKRLGIIAQSWEACDDYLEQMESQYAAFDIEVVAIERYEGKDTDMRTQLSKLKNTNLEAWFACGAYQDTGLVFKQAKDLGFAKPAFGMVAVENKKLFDIAGDAAEGVIFTSTKWSCEHAESFCATFIKTYNATPDYRTAFGYDSMMLAAEAIRRGGTTPEGIQQGLLGIQGYLGAGGETSFDADGNAKKEVIVKQVKGNSFVNI
jgi:branched-chain amino acid transport system substrate-binding protein